MQIDIVKPGPRKASSRARSQLRIWDLGFDSCRWPVGPATEPAVFFCGQPTANGCSWCSEHRRLAFTRGAEARA